VKRYRWFNQLFCSHISPSRERSRIHQRAYNLSRFFNLRMHGARCGFSTDGKLEEERSGDA